MFVLILYCKEILHNCKVKIYFIQHKINFTSD